MDGSIRPNYVMRDVERVSLWYNSHIFGKYFPKFVRFPEFEKSDLTCTNYDESNEVVSSIHSDLPVDQKLQNPKWDMKIIKDNFTNLKYFSIDCKCVKEFDFKLIPSTVEYLCLVNPPFADSDVPDCSHLPELKSLSVMSK